MFAKEITRYGPEVNARFEELSKATYRKVYNMAFRLAGNRSDAEDLTQEAFFRAYRSFRDYEGDRPFENWIFRIVSRLFLDLLRTRRRRVNSVSLDAPLANGVGDDHLVLEMADERPDPEQHLLDRSINEQLQEVLATLSPEQRMLITLADIQNVPYQEIAELVGKPVGTIRSRLHRTRTLIRKRLQALESQEPSPVRLDLGLRPC